MKKVFLLSATLFLVCLLRQAVALGTSSGTAGKANAASPSANPSIGSVPGLGANPNIYDLNIRLRQLTLQIQRDWKSGKLNEEQLQSSMEIVRTIRKKENLYYFQNGRADITAGQKAELLRLLDSVETP